MRHKLNPLFLALLALVLFAGLTAGAGEEGMAAAGPYLEDDETCLGCHEDYALPRSDVHARIEPFEVRGHRVGCEGCHGPGETHAEENDPELVGSFGAGGVGDLACMGCHEVKGLSQWHASTHASEGVGCADCHTVHDPAVDPRDTCKSCHNDVVASFQLPSHHPVREGKMSCASCHDVHNAQEAQLKTSMRANDLCYDCHQRFEGPFIFEHAPVQEDCANCHVPHGSVVNNLLVANQPALCLQCHELHFHSGYRASDDLEREVGGIERENRWGSPGFNIAFSTACTQCHARIHGTDNPSQTVTSRGRGLIH